MITDRNNKEVKNTVTRRIARWIWQRIDKWIVAPTLGWICNKYFSLRLNWIIPGIAVAAMSYFIAYAQFTTYLSNSFVKQWVPEQEKHVSFLEQ